MGATVKVIGESVDVAANTMTGFVGMRRHWKAGDVVDLNLPMGAERIYAHPNVRMDVGRTALKHGPFVYAIEQADNAAPVDRAVLPRSAKVEPSLRKDLFDGVVTLVADGQAIATGDDSALYRNAPPAAAPAHWTAIPYYLWNNRTPGKMLVWLPEAP
jgi:DUF1680 family protein